MIIPQETTKTFSTAVKAFIARGTRNFLTFHQTHRVFILIHV